MLRTGTPMFPGNIDILQVKRTVAVRDEDGNTRLWSVERKRDMFTITPARRAPRLQTPTFVKEG